MARPAMAEQNLGGVIFSVNTDGSNPRDLWDFDGSNAYNPERLVFSGNSFYGVSYGGAIYNGVIFSWRP